MQRFVWNFEIDTQYPLTMDAFSIEEKEEVRWERRFFWPENKIIKLHGLNQEFLKLSNYTVKPRCDRYYVLADSDANIKLRRGEMLYKP